MKPFSLVLIFASVVDAKKENTVVQKEAVPEHKPFENAKLIWNNNFA